MDSRLLMSGCVQTPVEEEHVHPESIQPCLHPPRAGRRLTGHTPLHSRQQSNRGFGRPAQFAQGKTIRNGNATHRWGVVLAGGNGVRLRPLTRFLCGDDRPKQFCPLLGDGTLLRDCLQRAERSIASDQILLPLTRAHRGYYQPDLAGHPCHRIVQPSNRGTAPAVLYPLLRICKMDRDAMVAILPCDHYYSEERLFTVALESAFAVAESRPKSVVLLGARPKHPEVEYGWIEVGYAVDNSHHDAYFVTGFAEKPALPVAERLLRSGALWNTFVMVGHVSAFLDMALASVPGLLLTLDSIANHPYGSANETHIDDDVYDHLASTDFSRQVLAQSANRLIALGLGDMEWNDLGDPNRVISTLLQRDGEVPHWAKRWCTQGENQHAAGACTSVAVA